VSYTLEQIDLIRQRMGVGYGEAKEALDQSSGDVIAALTVVEEQQRQAATAGSLEHIIEEVTQEVKEALSERSVERIDIKLGDKTVREVPVALAGVGAALLVILSALLAYISLDIIMDERTDNSGTRKN